MTIIDDYLELQEKYEAKYGEKTIVLMEVGGFFEVYGVVPDEPGRPQRGRIYEVSEITNLNVSKKGDKQSPVSEKNPLMAGFPSASFDKWKDILLRHGYTIIKVEQEMVAGKKEPVRKLSEILSPGLHMDAINITNHVMSIHIEEISDHRSFKTLWFVGISSVDITTGESYIYETHSTADDAYRAIDDIYRMLHMIRPIEVLLHTINDSGSAKQLIDTIQSTNASVHANLYNRPDYTHFQQPKFQQEFLRRVYPQTNMLSVVDYLGLERMPFALMSLVYLVQFCYEHNETYIEKWNKPIQWESSRFMECSHDAMEQLHIIPPTSRSNHSNNIQCLWDVLDHTATAMGRRKLRQSLSHPILDITELEHRYSVIDVLKTNREYTTLRKSMSMIVDTERYHRRIALKMIHPHQWISLEVSHRLITEVLCQYYKLIGQSNLEPIELLKKSMADYSRQLDFNKLVNVSKNQISHSIFYKGQYPEIDALDEEIALDTRKIKAIQRELSYIITSERNSDNPVVDWKSTDRDGDYFCVSTAKANSLKEKLKLRSSLSIRVDNPENELDTIIISIPTSKFEFKATASTARITFPDLDELAHRLSRNEAKMNRLCMEVYERILMELDNRWHDTWYIISNEIAQCDFLCSFAKSAAEYGYCRPSIQNSNGSFLKVSNIRHPIIERLPSVVEYVSNDLELGTGSSQGMLLYGLNAVGKSSLMKSVGLSIIMAQCGSFVPATEFTFYPYTNISTRIQTRDNLFKGQSTFAVEMCELRTILKKATERSLILGDELCSGTETTSGVAIVGATLVRLYEKKASFLFATHLHDLAKLEEVLECKNIRHVHMETTYDPATKKIIYNRKLKEGSGSAVYGLEVARALDLDRDFLELANSIRKRRIGLQETLVGNKTSTYNSHIIKDKCNVCGNTTEEIHHIKEQQYADENGFHGHIHKNTLHNLVQLCRNCHQAVHHGGLHIEGWKQTSDGVELKYEWKTVCESGDNDYVSLDSQDTPDELKDRVFELYGKCKKYTQVRILLKSYYNIDCSVYRIKKILKI
jgi:DNA mismatch repair protein MutS